MAAAPPHTTRASIFQQEARWTLTPDALERIGGEPAQAPFWARLARLIVLVMMPWGLDRIEAGGPARFRYADIRTLRLSYEPTGDRVQRYRCDVRTVDGRTAFLYSTSCKSATVLEDRAASYVPLVRELVARVAAASPGCRFRAGKRPLAYWAQNIALLILFTLMILVLFMVGGSGLSEFSWAKIGMIAALAPVVILSTRKNWPRTLSPGAIPGDILPAVDAVRR
jgi:hypothetical protein